MNKLKRMHSFIAYDPYPVVLEGLNTIVQRSGELSLVSSASTFGDLIRLVQEHSPKLALFASGPHMKDAVQQLAQLRSVAPQTLPVLWAGEIPEQEAYRA